jgi:hypothetical protein
VPAFDFSVRLRIVGRCSDVCHARDADKLFEILGDELRAVVGNDPRSGLRVLLLGRLQGVRGSNPRAPTNVKTHFFAMAVPGPASAPVAVCGVLGFLEAPDSYNSDYSVRASRTQSKGNALSSFRAAQVRLVRVSTVSSSNPV